jgi:hypothetical protein
MTLLGRLVRRWRRSRRSRCPMGPLLGTLVLGRPAERLR